MSETDDFAFLDPDRPPVVYECDMSVEQRKRFADVMAATKRRAAMSWCRPPWTVRLADGTTVIVGNGEEPVIVPPLGEET